MSRVTFAICCIIAIIIPTEGLGVISRRRTRRNRNAARYRCAMEMCLQKYPVVETTYCLDNGDLTSCWTTRHSKCLEEGIRVKKVRGTKNPVRDLIGIFWYPIRACVKLILALLVFRFIFTRFV